MSLSPATLRRRLPVMDAEVLEPLPPTRWRPAADEVGPDDEEVFASRTTPSTHRFRRSWLTGAAVLGALTIYPAMVVAASHIDLGLQLSGFDQGEWSAAWAGTAAALLESQYEGSGWAADASSWAPMAQLTAKPAFQTALAESVGELLAMKAGPEGTGAPGESDLQAAVRLVGPESSGVQLRAASDALRSFDSRLRRAGGRDDSRGSAALATLTLATEWADLSKTELARIAESADGNPLDRSATQAVYGAKARAVASYAFLSTLDWPDDPQARGARTNALNAWKTAAEFHPLIVLNASPEATLFGNHPAAMGFLIDRAEAATTAYAVALRASDIEPN